jgi:hypothetical protein
MAALSRGCSWSSRRQGFEYKKCISGKRVSLGFVRESDGQQSAVVETAARHYDAVELLLRGPFANTNFEWSTYTQDDVAAAAKFLEGKGINVHKAVIASRDGQGARDWIGVRQQDRKWHAQVNCRRDNGNEGIGITWPRWSSAEAAAQHADCGLLAVHGLQVTTNFPASGYSEEQLQEAGQHAISKGADPERVHRNVEAVGKVS